MRLPHLRLFNLCMLHPISLLSICLLSFQARMVQQVLHMRMLRDWSLPISPFQITAWIPGNVSLHSSHSAKLHGAKVRAGGRFYHDKALFQRHQYPCVADVSAIKSPYLES